VMVAWPKWWTGADSVPACQSMSRRPGAAAACAPSG
jgi:hypothetical protein